MALKHTFVSGIADGADATQVRPSNWNADHLIDLNGVNITANASVPATPAAGTLQLYIDSAGGANILSTVGSSGKLEGYQRDMASRAIYQFNPIAGAATIPILNGLAFTTPVGTATSRPLGSGVPPLNSYKRLGFVSAATAGALTHIRSGATTVGASILAVGAVPTFYTKAAFSFGISDAATVAGARMFIGVAASLAAPTNVEPNTLLTCIGIAQLSTDATQLYMVCAGSTTAQTAVPLGATNFPVTNANAYRLEVFMPKQVTTSIAWEVTNIATQVAVSGTFTGTATTLPNGNAATGGLAVHAWRTNNAVALAVSMDILNITIEQG